MLAPWTRRVSPAHEGQPAGQSEQPDRLVRGVSRDRGTGGLCRTHGLALIGDEVFADYLLSIDAVPSSVLGQQAALTFGLGGLSKAAGLPQVKLGWIGIGGPDDDVNDALRSAGRHRRCVLVRFHTGSGGPAGA